MRYRRTRYYVHATRGWRAVFKFAWECGRGVVYLPQNIFSIDSKWHKVAKENEPTTYGERNQKDKREREAQGRREEETEKSRERGKERKKEDEERAVKTDRSDKRTVEKHEMRENES